MSNGSRLCSFRRVRDAYDTAKQTVDPREGAVGVGCGNSLVNIVSARSYVACLSCTPYTSMCRVHYFRGISALIYGNYLSR